MEWRCKWCGKPHEENDPPCDNCGHSKFERAVEQMGPETTDGPQDPVWVCTECGRQHTKNSPPCSRCGNINLEKRQPDWDELDDLGGTTYRDVLEPRYVAGYIVAAILGGILVLGYFGVIQVPGIGPAPQPPVPEVPGEGEQVGDLSIGAVEESYIEQLNEQRTAAGDGVLTNDSDLAWYSAYVNKRSVDATDGDGEDLTQEEVNQIREYCDRRPLVTAYSVFPSGTVTDFENESALANALLDGLSDENRQTLLSESRERIGVDVHVGQNDRVFVTVAAC